LIRFTTACAVVTSDQTSRTASNHYTELSEITEDFEMRPAIADLPNFGEELALVLSAHGMQRMTARVLAALLFTEQPSMTASDLGGRLQASSGAISGAVKMLTSVGLVERVPAPGSRRDHYRLRDNAWAIQYTNQNEVTSAVLEAAEAGIAATEDGSLARQRLTQMRDFYSFLFAEIPALLDRWYQRSGSTERYPTVVRFRRLP
jgi:DNA-binding transcriptional regulator GbsR (MarR family)